MTESPNKYLTELERDLEGGIDSALRMPAAQPESSEDEAEHRRTPKEKVYSNAMRLLIGLLEEGKLDPNMTAAELPAFLKDEMKKPD